MTPYEVVLNSNFPERHVELTKNGSSSEFYAEKAQKTVALSQKMPCNAIINGASGSGKTALATILAVKVYLSHGTFCRYETAQRICMRLEQERFNRDNAVFRDLTSNIESVLFIDEFLSRDYSPYEIDFFQAVLDDRYNAMLSTVFITNLTLDEMRAKVGDKFIHRITQEGHVISLNQVDGRK